MPAPKLLPIPTTVPRELVILRQMIRQADKDYRKANNAYAEARKKVRQCRERLIDIRARLNTLAEVELLFLDLETKDAGRTAESDSSPSFSSDSGVKGPYADGAGPQTG